MDRKVRKDRLDLRDQRDLPVVLLDLRDQRVLQDLRVTRGVLETTPNRKLVWRTITPS